jgi:hypothetical protein
MSTLKKVLPFAVLLGIAGVFGGTYAVYASTKARQEQARRDAFADLSMCLLGERVASGDDTINGITANQARVAHVLDERRGVVDGKPWPQRCAQHSVALMDAVRASSLLDEAAKSDLLKVSDELAKELAAPRAQDAYLARAVLALWRSAEKSGLLIGESSSVAGPPRPTPLEGSPDVSFSSMYLVPGGPQWAFLVERKDKPNTLGACSIGKDDLECREFATEGFIKNGCTWDSLDHLPIVEDRSLKILERGKRVEVGSIAASHDECHVDAEGNFFGLVQGYERKLLVRTVGKELVEKRLDELLEVEESAPIVAAFVVGTHLIVDRSGALEGYALGPKGLQKKSKLDLGKSPSSAYRFARAGKNWFLQTVSEETTQRLFDGAKLGPPVKATSPFLGTLASGHSFTRQQLCDAERCQSWMEDVEAQAFREATGQIPAKGVFGGNLVLGWAAKEGQGVLMRISKLGDPDSAKEVLISERSDPKKTIVLVYGDDDGAVIFAEIEKRVVGARVKADGSVGPMNLRWIE